jgi:hypothetical protein
MPQSQTWSVSCDATSMSQKGTISVKYFMSYHPETIFLFLVTLTLTLSPPAPKSNLTCILWCYICVPNFFLIFDSFQELSSGKHFSIFSNSDLDTDPTSPKIELDLYLMMLHLCTKNYLNLSSLSWVIIRKRRIRPTDRPTSSLLYTPSNFVCGGIMMV